MTRECIHLLFATICIIFIKTVLLMYTPRINKNHQQMCVITCILRAWICICSAFKQRHKGRPDLLLTQPLFSLLWNLCSLNNHASLWQYMLGKTHTPRVNKGRGERYEIANTNKHSIMCVLLQLYRFLHLSENVIRHIFTLYLLIVFCSGGELLQKAIPAKSCFQRLIS